MRSLIKKIPQHQVWSKEKSGRENPSKSYPGTFQKRLRLGEKKCSRSSSACPVTTMPPEPSEASTLPSPSSLELSMFVLSESASLSHKRLANPTVPLRPLLTETHDGSKDA